MRNDVYDMSTIIAKARSEIKKNKTLLNSCNQARNTYIAERIIASGYRRVMDENGDMIPDSAILETYTKRMEASVDNDNKEEGHVKCDGVICDFLRTLGYGTVVEAYDKQEKWYS